MSAQNFKPGDVAIATLFSGSEVPVIRASGDCRLCGSYEADHWHGAHGNLPPRYESVRRLVVIDPEDREQVERLYVEYVSAAGVVDNGYVDEMQAALREFANPTPPKPDEPTGHLAVVIDTNGNRWINWRDLRDDMDHERPWVLASDGFTYREYADIDVAEIKWEGIQ